MGCFRFAALALFAVASCTAEVAVVVPRTASPVVKFAGTQLVSYLGRMYPEEKFVLRTTAPGVGRFVRFEGRSAGPPEGFTISTSGNVAAIASEGDRGAMYAVYSLLEKLGCGFYLSYETVPAPRAGSVNFNEWKMADAPLVRDRIVFDWHNFLSSASTWEYEDWVRYIDAAAKMRFNDVMVHAYGNNPMFTFRFGGVGKPVGFLATTRAGRDWGTQHVNDVRRMVGGELFAEPVFGASIANNGAGAAMGLMQRVFRHARDRGMKVTFALDIDTESANPQEMIAKLPEAARVRSGKWLLANPDTPPGYAFYKAQTEQLLAAYPEITRLALWFRDGGTPWRSIKVEEFPEAWKREFHGSPGDASMFAVSKVIAAYGRALRESGHSQVELAGGSWRLHFLESADRYLPREATLLPLDWETVFDTPAGQRDLRTVRSGRRLVPIVWAHHDDRTYIGRPYTPYVNFRTLLESAGASGFGIIHWTTRPLDLYFKSTVDQVWQATANQPLIEACERMAVRTFGREGKAAGRDYLFSFVTEAPMFGRETSDRFMDVLLKEPELQVKRAKGRSAMLDGVKGSEYFRGYEEFIAAFFETQTHLERAQALLKLSDFAAARQELRGAKPEAVIATYVRAVQCGGPTPGEKALVVSLNLRWLPYFVSAREAAGLEPVRLRIGKVETEPLAQGPGHNTFHFDEQGRLWRVLDRDVLAGRLKTAAMMSDRLEPGRYRVNGGDPIEAKNGFVEFAVPTGAEEIVISRVP